MEDVSVGGICGGSRTVDFYADPHGIDEYSAFSDWATVVRHYNSSEEPVLLDGREVWGSVRV